MKDPFTGIPMITVNNGSLADYYENGGLEEDIYYHLWEFHGSRWVNNMKVGDTRHLDFEIRDKDHKDNILKIYVWILRINESDTPKNDFRYFYSSQGVREEKSLRGMN